MSTEFKAVNISVPTVIGVAIEVLYGVYGNGQERIEKLNAAGYDADKVQSCVNDIVKLLVKWED